MISHGDLSAAERQAGPVRLDRPVLVGNIVSGCAWLLLLALLGSWVLALIGAAYGAAGSVFLAAVSARDSLTVRQQALSWATSWLVAVALWTFIASGIDGGKANPLLSLWVGLMIGTATYLAWQTMALAVGHLVRTASAVPRHR